MSTTVEITIRRLPDASLAAELRAELPNSRADLGTAPVTISAEALRGLELLPDAYGAALTAMALPTTLHPAWAKAKGHAEGARHGFHVRLDIDDPTGALHALRWELLRDPLTNAPLATQEGGSLARLVVVTDLHDAAPPPKPALRALAAVAGPADAAHWGLTPVDVAAEAQRALEALGTIPADLLAHGHPRSSGRATLASLRNSLRKPVHVLSLIAHGKATDAGTVLYLEGNNGNAAPITGADLAESISALAPAHRPLLAVLIACESADQEAAPLASVGPLLARAGVPAVIAMQSRVSMEAAAPFTARLLRELERDGRIDRALAAARAEMGDEWWVPVLWLRSRDSRLWAGEAAEDRQRDQRLRALLHEHSGFIASRMKAFVGRAAELAEIRVRIAEKLPTGGYVTITGQAGQGKSSVIARLVADALGDQSAIRQRLSSPAAGVPICHFIPFSPGPDHQVGLLRNLIARLCLSYGLPDFYATNDSRPALRDYFAAALRDLAKQGKQEVIYIDGLDQIEEDASGVRDLSFLPEEPPKGIVFVLGTRPNDTLKPLELRKPQHEYWLPALSRADFDLILVHRGVKLDTSLADRFYAAMQENALYLDLVARELAQTDAIDPEQIIARVADNPANLFSLSIERLQRHERQWETVLHPILGLLLATRAPLSQRALRALIGADELRTKQGLQRLGGLLQRDGEGRYGLFHLKLGEFLRQAVFAADEEESYHQQLADWCEGGKGGSGVIWADVPGDALEQERRAYARQHYIAHLAAARSYERLWGVIDAGEYGREKRRYDPSTRSYALDLDIVRQAVIDEAGGDTGKQAWGLPRLWRYGLLRCSLTTRADNYPEELFLALVALGHRSEAINLAEVISDPVRKVRTLGKIAVALLVGGIKEGEEDFLRAKTIADTISNERDRAVALSELATTLAVARHPSTSTAIADARTVADRVSRSQNCAIALHSLVTALAAAEYWDEACVTADSIPDDGLRVAALGKLAVALDATRHPLATSIFARARSTAEAMPEEQDRVAALINLAEYFTETHHWDEANITQDAVPGNWDLDAFARIKAVMLAVNQHWDEARATANTISREQDRAAAFKDMAIALVTAQRWDEAQATADVISVETYRSAALGAVAAALATAQHPSAAATLTRARAAADIVSVGKVRDDAFYRLSTTFAAAQHWDKARAATNAISDAVLRISALGNLAAALATTQHPAAKATFEQARAAADTLSGEWLRSNVLLQLSIVLARVQWWNDARACTDVIPDKWVRANALLSLIAALAANHYWNDARTIISTIPDEYVCATALRTLATAFANAKYWDEARSTADAIPLTGIRADTLKEISIALTAAHHPSAITTFTHARTAIDAIFDQKQHSIALSKLAAALITANHPLATATFAEAHESINALVSSGEHVALLHYLYLVEALVATQCWEDAHTIADTIPDETSRSAVLRNLAKALATAQCWDNARNTADAIPVDRYRVTALSELAAALTAVDQPLAIATFAQARATADAIIDEGNRTIALRNLAEALATAQFWDEARTTTDAVPDEQNRAEGLGYLTEVFITNKRWGDTHSTADAIPENNARAKAFRALAEALAQAGLLPQAISLLADLWLLAQTRDELLRLFVVPPELLRAYPELGQEFLDSFAWVDAQLAVG